MRERRSADRGIDARRGNDLHCDALPSVTLARYLTSALPKDDRGAVDAHLQGCDECRALLDSADKLLYGT